MNKKTDQEQGTSTIQLTTICIARIRSGKKESNSISNPLALIPYCKRAETLREREKERIIFISINLCVFLNISFTTIYINQFCYYNATSFLSVIVW